MARNASGTYALPAGNPVVTATTIQSSWANTTLSDIATEMTDSLDRSGKGGMLASLLLVDGTVAGPGFGFNSEVNTGFYRAGAGDLRAAVLGTDILRMSGGTVSVLGASGLSVSNALSVTGTSQLTGAVTVGASGVGTVNAAILTAAGTANQGLTLRGNKAAADTGTDVLISGASGVTRSGGLLLDVQNNGTSEFNVGPTGAITVNGSATFNSSVFVNSGTLQAALFDSTQFQTSTANATVTIRGNRSGADAGTDVVLRGSATRSAGALLDVWNNTTSKAQVDYLGNVHGLNQDQRFYNTASWSTTSSVLANVPGFTFSVVANGIYAFDIIIYGIGAGTSVNFAFTMPASPTQLQYSWVAAPLGAALQGNTKAALGTEVITLSGSQYYTVHIRGMLQNGANAGAVQLQMASVTNTAQSSVFGGSYMEWRRLDGPYA